MTWFIFGIITFFIAPAIILIGSILSHNWFLNPASVLICLIIGLAFGLGMFLFTKAVNLIGIGIPFALNIGLGTLSGSLFSLVIHGNYQLLDKFSIIAFVLFLIAIGLYAISLSLRDVSTDKKMD